MHRISRVIAVLTLCATGAVQAQAPDYPAKAELVPCSKTTLYYKYPVGTKTYECCTPKDPLVLAPDTVTTKPSVHPVTRFLGEGAIAFAKRTVATCTDLSTLTPIERIQRTTSVALDTCNQFSVYDHVVCTCENFCFDVNTFLCNCPGLPAGELPKIGPQDSLGSQPELIGETCTPCGSHSSCCEGF